MCPSGVPRGLQQVEASRSTSPSSQCGHCEPPQSGRLVWGPDSHLSTSAPVPDVSAPGSASVVPPAAGNPLPAGVRSADQGLGRVTILCRSNSRLAHLAKVPGTFHLQARLSNLRVGQTTQIPQGKVGRACPPQQPRVPPASSSCGRSQGLDAHLLLQCPGTPAFLLLLAAEGLGLPLPRLQV